MTWTLAAQRWRRSEARFVPWVAFAALTLAPAVITQNWPFVGLIVFVMATVSAYLWSPTAGLAAVALLWTFSPLVRRLLDYGIDARTGPDVLSLAPFFATFIVGTIAFARTRPTKPVLWVLGGLWAGLLWGVPLGLDDPYALMFALFSYVAASMSLLLGYADWRRGALVLERVLVVLIPVIAAYGIYQYFADVLPGWDELWLKTKAPISTGSKVTDDFRAFSVMNSPGSLAATLAMFGLMLIVARRLDPARIVAGGLAMAALAFTQVRSSWLAMATALIVLVPFARGAVVGRVAILLMILGGMYLTVGNSTAGQAVVDRASTLAAPRQDTSVRARLDAVTTFGPQALTQPLGAGLGSAGQAARISVKGEAPFADNGYLIIVWQVGLLGTVLIMGAILGGALYGARNLTRYRRADRFPLVAILVVAAVMHLSGDSLFGLPAVIFWYCLGALMASAEDEGCAAITQRRRAAAIAPPPRRPPVGGFRPNHGVAAAGTTST